MLQVNENQLYICGDGPVLQIGVSSWHVYACRLLADVYIFIFARLFNNTLHSINRHASFF